MIIALFIIIAAVVTVTIPVAVVVVSMASRREDAAWSLDKPARGVVQVVARRLVDFHSEGPAWPLPKNCGQARPTAPALHSVGRGPVERGPVAHPRVSTVTDSRRSAATSKISIRTAA